MLSGHDHDYQRHKPRNGTVQFVAGTGGRERREVNGSYPGLRAFDDGHFGALRLRLDGRVAKHKFIRSGGARKDSGKLECDRRR